MAIISGLQISFGKIKPEEITGFLRSDYSQESNFIADMISFNKATGDNNTIPKEPSKLGINSLIDASGIWTSKASLLSLNTYLSSAPLTSDSLINIAGYNGTGYLNTSQKYTLSSNGWTSRGTTNFARAFNGGAGLTSDYSLTFGGANSGSSYLTSTERYQDSGSAWSNRSGVLSTARGYIQSASMTTDICLSMGGTNSSSAVTNHDKYSNTSDAWTTAAVFPNANSARGAGSSLTADIAIAMDPLNSSGFTGVYLISLNSWITKTSISTPRAYETSFAQTSDLVTIAGGLTARTDRYSLSANAWSSKINVPTGADSSASSSFTANKGLLFGGINSTAQTTCYSYVDNCVSLVSGLDLVSNQVNNSPAVPDNTSTQQFVTKTLLSFIPSKIVANVVSTKLASTSDATVDISADGGTTWGVTGKTINTIISCSGLSGSDFRLRFNLARDASANTWVLRTVRPTVGNGFAAGTLSSDFTVCMGAYASSISTNTERFSDSGNSWLSRVSAATPVSGSAGLSLAGLSALKVTGGSPFTNVVEKFADSSNTWLNRMVYGDACYYPASASFTSDRGLIYGGYNAVTVSAIPYRYQDSTNNWTSRNSPIFSAYQGGGCSLTSDKAFKTDSNPYTTIFSDTANTWTTKNSPIRGLIYGRGVSSIDADSCIIYGGYQSGYQNEVERFSDSGNFFIMRSPQLIATHNASWGTQCSNGQLSIGGDNGAYHGNTQRYTDGETYCKGFGVRYSS